MRFHLSVSLAVALAVASVAPVAAGNLVDPAIEGETMVAPDAPVSSMGSLGGGAAIGVLALLAIAAVLAHQSSKWPAMFFSCSAMASLMSSK